MLTFPPVRYQGDGRQDEASERAGISFPMNEDKTRQEFKDEVDVNNILRRFGVVGNGRPPIFTETRFDLDLSTAFNEVAQAREAYQRAPIELRKKYPTFEEYVEAVETGRYEKPDQDKRPAEKKEVPPEATNSEPE